MTSNSSSSKQQSSGCRQTVLIVIASTICVAVVVLGVPWFLISNWFAAGERRLDDELTLLQETGEPISPADLEAFYRLPEGATDTTELWTQAARTFETERFASESQVLFSLVTPEFKLPPPGESWEQFEDARALLKAYRVQMEQMYEAAQLGGAARYESSFADGFASEVSVAQALRAAAWMLTLEMYVKAHEGDSPGVLRAVRTKLALAESLATHPQSIEQLVRIAIASFTEYELARLLPHMDFSDQDLASLMDELASHDYGTALYHMLLGERVNGLHMFDHPDVAGSDLDFDEMAQWTQKWMSSDRAYYLQQMRLLIEASRQPFPQRLRSSAQLGAESEETFKNAGEIAKLRMLFSMLLLPAQDALCQACARATALRDSMIVVLAIERYRKQSDEMPASLAQLVPKFLDAVPADPFDGNPLRCHVDADRYFVYSIGRNGQDDGGEDESKGGSDHGLSVQLSR